MKWLNRKILGTSKLVLLYSLLLGGGHAAELVSSDRFLLKVLDRTISFQDIAFHQRNLKALSCVYPESMVVNYFEKKMVKDLAQFVTKFPKDEVAVKKYLHGHESTLKEIRLYFKMLRYSEDQNSKVTPEISELIREGSKDNKCDLGIIYKDTLKTNFISLLKLELYLKSRYGAQLKSSKSGFQGIRPSLDLFTESLDKQFGHEYFW